MYKQQHLKYLSKNLSTSFILLFTFCFCLNANATLLNSDFSSGFDNWQAEVEYIDSITGDDEFADGDVIASFPDSFSSGGNSATLTTAFDSNNSNEVWSVVMYQDFMLDSIMFGNSLWLSLDVIFNVTDGGAGLIDDLAFAQLSNSMGSILLDLTAGGTFNVTAWAGSDVTLEFAITDGDFKLGDTLTVSNINIEEITATSVPVPATLFLCILGLVLLKRNRA